jgi:signal peptidase I
MKNNALKFTKSKKYYLLLVVYVVFVYVGISLSLVRFVGILPMANISGSMSPAVKTGSLSILLKKEYYAPQDIIAFYSKNEAGEEEIVTHRVQKIAGNVYITKGDANEAIDEQKVVPRLVIGKVLLAVPFLGYFYIFAKSVTGTMLLIIFPALFFVVVEVIRIIRIGR